MSDVRRNGQPVSDRVATPRPFVDPTSQHYSSEPQPAESTPLLLKKDVRSSHGRRRNVHYRGISGPRFKVLFPSLIFGITIAFFDSTLMASSHPVITSYFNASNAASWLSTVFYLTSTVFQPINGRISDTIGRRPVLLFTTAMFFLSTAWCGLAGSIGSFIAARAVCGLGAGGVISMASILTSDLVKIEYRGIYQSYINLAFGVGNGLGAAFGGFLCDRLGWRAAFYVQLPFIFVFGIVSIFACPTDLGPNLARNQGVTIREAFRSFDTLGAVVLTVTITCLILGVNLGGNIFGWTHPLVITSLVLFAVAGISLVFVERKAKYPMLPLAFLSTIPNANLMWSNFLGSMVANNVLFNVPLFFQAVRLSSPTASGLYLISPLVGIGVTAIFSGAYITITRKMKPMMSIGVFVLLCGSIGVSCLDNSMPDWAVTMLIPFCNIALGFFFPAVMIAVLAINPPAEQAIVTTTLGLIRNLGNILGVALSSWILQNALLIYLRELVTAPTQELKDAIIRQARDSVRSIGSLDPLHQGQVREAYARALRATFMSTILLSPVAIALIWPVSIPDLPRQEDVDAHEAEVDTGTGTSATASQRGYDDEDEDEESEAETTAMLQREITRESGVSFAVSSASGSLAGSAPRLPTIDRQRRPSFETGFAAMSS